MQTHGQYRTKEAKDIHTIIMGYMVNQYDIDQVKEVFEQNKKNYQAMSEKSQSKHNHLHDILHLPFSLRPTGEVLAQRPGKTPARVSLNLFNTLFEVIRDEDELVEAFLLDQDSHKLTPLRTILINGEPINIMAFIETITTLRKEGHLSHNKYKDILLAVTNSFPLIVDLMLMHHENAKAYFQAIFKAFDENQRANLGSGQSLEMRDYSDILTGRTDNIKSFLTTALTDKRFNIDTFREYLQLLTHSLKRGLLNIEFFKILHGKGLIFDLTKKPEAFACYLTSMTEALSTKIISPNDFMELIKGSHKSTYILHHLIDTKDEKNLSAYLQTFGNVIEQGLIAPIHFVELLSIKDGNGFPFTHACKSLPIFSVFMNELDSLIEKDVILPDNLIKLLSMYEDPCAPMVFLTMLQSSLNEVVNRCFESLEKISLTTSKKTAEMLRYFLLNWRAMGNNVYQHLLESAHKKPESIFAYLSFLDKLRKIEVISDDDFVACLFNKNKSGFTPLMGALASCRTEVINDYYSRVIQVKNHASSEQLQKLFVEPNVEKSSSLHIAVETGDLNIVKGLIQFLRSFYTRKLANQYIAEMFAHKAVSCSATLPGAIEVNTYLRGLKEELGIKDDVKVDVQDRVEMSEPAKPAVSVAQFSILNPSPSIADNMNDDPSRYSLAAFIKIKPAKKKGGGKNH